MDTLDRDAGPPKDQVIVFDIVPDEIYVAIKYPFQNFQYFVLGQVLEISFI